MRFLGIHRPTKLKGAAKSALEIWTLIEVICIVGPEISTYIVQRDSLEHEHKMLYSLE